MRIGIVVGSIRESRKGMSVGEWVHSLAADRPGAEYALIDLKSFNVPLLTSATVPGAANRQYESAEVRAWGAAIDGCDGFVFVTPEYNHGVPGAFKNAVDSLYPEFVGKTVGFVSYGADGGIRSVEHWRPVVANFQMVDVRAQVALSIFTDFSGDQFTPGERRGAEVGVLLDQLESVTAKVRA